MAKKQRKKSHTSALIPSLIVVAFMLFPVIIYGALIRNEVLTETGSTTSRIVAGIASSRDMADLALLSMTITTLSASCDASEWGVRVFIANQGQRNASNFVVSVNGAKKSYEGTLVAGGKISLWIPVGLHKNENTPIDASVDSTNTVRESDETNNTRVQTLPWPSPLPSCTK